MTVAAGSRALTPYERGRDIYNYRCYFCHGYAGDGNTLASTYLSPPPRNFYATDPVQLTRDTMIAAVSNGKPGTAMMAFSAVLSAQEIAEVVDFVRAEFMGGQGRATRYHTAENGWPNHDRFRAAFPFVNGELPLDQPVDALSPEQQEGRRLFMSACITCHDRPRAGGEGQIWNRRSISFPRGGYDHKKSAEVDIDAVSGATPYAQHDVPRASSAPADSDGARLFQDNCAFCHGADGSGKNWIGSFLQPHPRDLTQERDWSREHLSWVVRDGIEGTTMSAWRNVLTEQEIQSVVDYVLEQVQEQSTKGNKAAFGSGQNDRTQEANQ